jgi:hypothetical protein
MFLADNNYKFYHYHAIMELCGAEVKQHGTGRLGSDPKKLRRVYYAKGRAIKIWGQEFRGGDKIMRAIPTGYYHNLSPALIGLVFDDEANCRGYVMKKGGLSVQPHHYHSMLKRIIEEADRTGIVFTDCIIQNMCLCGDVCLMDLESICFLQDGKIPKTKRVEVNLRLPEISAKFLKSS